MKEQIIYKSVDDLIPYENNPRKNDEAVDYVAKSIEEFGFKVPIVIDENNIIVAGHTRLRASKELGLKEVPTIVANDLSAEQVKAFRLADNKTSEFAEWDEELLTSELEGLEDLLVNMEDFGFQKLDVPDFSPTGEDEQPRLDELDPKIVQCPHCGSEFDLNE